MIYLKMHAVLVNALTSNPVSRDLITIHCPPIYAIYTEDSIISKFLF